jgi:uncharacterized membrane protein
MLLILVLALAFLMGCVCGLRSMTGPAVVCWAAHLGWLQLDGTWLGFLHHPASLVVFTLLAIGELIADKLPFIPKRTMIGPLAVRFVFGTACGYAVTLFAGHAVFPFALAGGLGGLAGGFGGYHLRRWLTAGRGLPDLPVALVEDLLAIGVGLFVAYGGFFRGLVIVSGWF